MTKDNPAIDNLVSRRTIRQFDGRPVEEEALQTILKAAMAAPTAFDARPWHFVLVDDPAVMATLSKRMGGCEMCEQTPNGILVCADPSTEKLPGIWIQDCSACVQNIQLAVHALGLATVWLAIYLVEERIQAVREIMNIPSTLIPFALLPVGYPNELPDQRERFLPERVHRNYMAEQ